MSSPQVCTCELKNLVRPAVEHRLDHVKGEALCHLGGDFGRNRELLSVHHCIDQDRALMRESSADAGFDIDRIFDSDATYPSGFRHRGKIRVLETCPEVE